ncbi:hypothetical protein BDY24DRAFT_381937 [Mrakia frigida]|uniref:uncharacterized protein n=1 Tax=Mrakia frigida TaxID=29902 RepID=UPI003FCC0656
MSSHQQHRPAESSSNSANAAAAAAAAAAGGESKRDRKRREWVEKVEFKHKERMEDRDRMYIETHTHLSHLASSLLPLPPTSQSYLLSLYSLTLERDALLSQISHHHEYRLDSSRKLFELERAKLEDDYRKAREGVKQMLLDKVEERRKRLREEKDGGDILDSYSIPPLPSSSSNPSGSLLSSSSSTSNRKLRPSRHSRLLSPSNLASLLDSDPNNPLLPPALLASESLPPSFLSLSVLSHPSLSRTSTSALNSPFAFHGSNANSNGNNNNSNNPNGTNGSAGGSEGGRPNAKKARNAPGGPTTNTASSNNAKSANAANANGGAGGEERIFLFIAGKSLTDLGKLVKGSEAEVEGDLGEIRRNWRGGGVTGRGRRGAAIKADAASRG